MRKGFKHLLFAIIGVGAVGEFYGCAKMAHEAGPTERVVLREEQELTQFEKVRIGATTEEVDGLLGEPVFVGHDSRYYGHTPRIRAIDSPYSTTSIIVRMDKGRVVEKQYVPDHPDAPGSKWGRSNEPDGVLERIDRQWRTRWTAVDDPKGLYSRKAFAARDATVVFGEIEANSVLAALQDDELAEKYADVLPWLIEPLMAYLVRSNDNARMVRLLSVRCPQYMQWDVPIEQWLACEAPLLGCPEAFGSLIDAWGASTDFKNRDAVTESLRAGWASMGWGAVDSDEELVARFSTWYADNKERYKGNSDAMTRDRQGADANRPLFVPK